jgi:hypothetical protein
MANGHGGARTPANPAPASGPGVFSRRTDGRQPVIDLPDAKYGENAQFRADESGAPIPQTSPIPQAPSAGPSAPPNALPVGQDPLNPPVPLSAGTLAPNVPVTDGAATGPGAGTDALNLKNPVQAQHASALSLVQSLASSPTASPAIRFLASSLSGSF